MTSPISTFSAESEASRSPRKPRVSARSGLRKSSHTPAACSSSDSLESRISETCDAGMLPGLAESLSSAPATRASLRPSPGSEKAREMTAGSGRQLATYSRSSGPLGSLVRMCLGTSRWGSTMCWLTWKISVTPRNRLLFQLVPLERGTDETESGLLPTLTVAGNYNRKGASATAADGLATAIKKLLPTLIATDGHKAPKQYSNGLPSLTTAVKALIPTLCARDYRHPGRSRMERTGGSQGECLPQYLNGPLNPRWCEWFMGYPIGHTELRDSGTRSSRKSRSNSSNSSPRSRAA